MLDISTLDISPPGHFLPNANHKPNPNSDPNPNINPINPNPTAPTLTLTLQTPLLTLTLTEQGRGNVRWENWFHLQPGGRSQPA